jgi:predicted nuclease of predicted toxin-antitoxin system
MKFKIDENIPVDAAQLLSEAGHNVHTVYEEALNGEADEIVAKKVRREKRILLTCDLDFADIRRYPPEEYSGIVVFRLKKQDKKSILSALHGVLPIFEIEEIRGRLWIVEDEKIRIRE